MSRPEVILLMGAFGIGKTTFANWAKNIGVVHGELDVNKNSYFKPYYKAVKEGQRPNPYVLGSQRSFAQASYAQGQEILRQIQHGVKLIFWDMPITAHFIYPWLQRQAKDGEQPIMVASDFEQYLAEYKQMLHIMTDINQVATVTVVMLYVDRLETLLERIAERDREEERGIDPAFVNVFHEQWLERLESKRLLPIEAEKMMGVDSQTFFSHLVAVNAAEFNWKDQAGFTQVFEFIKMSQLARSE